MMHKIVITQKESKEEANQLNISEILPHVVKF